MLLYHEKNNTKREVLQFLFLQNFYDRIICGFKISSYLFADGAGDMSQDLKTGYILGATPKKQQIDGKRSVKEIADLLKKKFGDETEPLYPRISLYMKSLYDNSFVVSVE